MESRGTHQFKIKNPKNYLLQVSISKKPKPITTPNLEVDFVCSFTQFYDTGVHLESHLEHASNPDQPINSIDLIPFLISNSKVQQVHQITWSYSRALDQLPIARHIP